MMSLICISYYVANNVLEIMSMKELNSVEFKRVQTIHEFSSKKSRSSRNLDVTENKAAAESVKNAES